MMKRLTVGTSFVNGGGSPFLCDNESSEGISHLFFYELALWGVAIW